MEKPHTWPWRTRRWCSSTQWSRKNAASSSKRSGDWRGDLAIEGKLRMGCYTLQNGCICLKICLYIYIYNYSVYIYIYYYIYDVCIDIILLIFWAVTFKHRLCMAVWSFLEFPKVVIGFELSNSVAAIFMSKWSKCGDLSTVKRKFHMGKKLGLRRPRNPCSNDREKPWITLGTEISKNYIPILHHHLSVWLMKYLFYPSV